MDDDDLHSPCNRGSGIEPSAPEKAGTEQPLRRVGDLIRVETFRAAVNGQQPEAGQTALLRRPKPFS